MTFDEAGFPDYLLSTIKAQGFPSPTPVQSQAWPMALSGRDVVAIAQTGVLYRIHIIARQLNSLFFRQREDDCLRTPSNTTH